MAEAESEMNRTATLLRRTAPLFQVSDSNKPTAGLSYPGET
jgi:hypothetical protein